jgi:molybdopterin/thiamine biosynthesis adenylyltransferase
MRSEISDRHMREVQGLADPAESRCITVAVEVAPAWAACAAGQFTATCLVNLLCRLTDLVSEVRVVCPDAPLLVRVPGSGDASTLLTALQRLPAWAVGGKVELVCGPGAADIRLAVDSSGTLDADFAGFGDGWNAWVGLPVHAPAVPPSASINPLGPFLAATLLAGEAFKKARGVTRGRPIERFSHSLWTGKGPEWASRSDAPELARLSMSPFYLVGAGAVGQALAYIIGCADFAEAFLVVLDDDAHDDTNLNRCFLAGADDANDPKIWAVERFLEGTNVGVYARKASLRSYFAGPRRKLRSDLVDAERRQEFDLVASCVDKGASRHDIQGLRPRLIIGGSTLNLTAKMNVYDGKLGTACLGCHNPPENDAERVRTLEQTLRKMNVDDQRLFLTGKVPDVDAVMASLAKPDCGSAGEQMLRAHAIEQPRQFSVSFVSMAAGILQGAELFRRMLFQQEGPRMVSLAFLGGKIEESIVAREVACIICGAAKDKAGLS